MDGWISLLYGVTVLALFALHSVPQTPAGGGKQKPNTTCAVDGRSIPGDNKNE